MKKAAILILAILLAAAALAGCGAPVENTMDFAELVGRENEALASARRWIAPDFLGWSCVEVAGFLDSVGQQYEIVFVDDADANVNAVTGQQPGSGETIGKNDVLRLEVNNYYARNNSVTLLYSYSKPISEMGKWIYYTDGASIFRTEYDFNEIEVIYSLGEEDERIVSVIPRTESLFFLTRDSDIKISLYSLDEDNGRAERIFGPEWCMDFSAAGDTLYFFAGDLWQYDTSQKVMKKMDISISTYAVIQKNEELYYVRKAVEKDEFLICRYGVDNRTEEILFKSDKMILNFCMGSNRIYYTEDSKNDNDDIYNKDTWLCDLNLDTLVNKTLMQIGSDQAFADLFRLFVWQDYIIAASSEQVTKIGIDGGGKKIVKSDPEPEIEVDPSVLCGNYIYWYSDYTNEGIALLNGRYNLITDEYEEFEWPDEMAG